MTTVPPGKSDRNQDGAPGHDNASSHQDSPQRTGSPVDKLARLWWIWFAAYFGLGAYAMQQGKTSVLAATVDHVDSLAISFLFLNLPLQMMLAMTAIVCDRSRFRQLRRAGIGIAVMTTLLILIHVILSFVTSIRVEG